MNGTRRASFLWGSTVCKVLTDGGFTEDNVVPMCFYNKKLDCNVVVHGDDFGADGEHDSLMQLDSLLMGNFQAKRLAVVGPGHDTEGKLLKRTIRWCQDG